MLSTAVFALLGLESVTQVNLTTDDTAEHVFSMPLCNGVNIEDATVQSLQRSLTLGHLSSYDLVQCYLARIDQTNK